MTCLSFCRQSQHMLGSLIIEHHELRNKNREYYTLHILFNRSRVQEMEPEWVVRWNTRKRIYFQYVWMKREKGLVVLYFYNLRMHSWVIKEHFTWERIKAGLCNLWSIVRVIGFLMNGTLTSHLNQYVSVCLYEREGGRAIRKYSLKNTKTKTCLVPYDSWIWGWEKEQHKEEIKSAIVRKGGDGSRWHTQQALALWSCSQERELLHCRNRSTTPWLLENWLRECQPALGMPVDPRHIRRLLG